jgi:hypothetical protein
MKIIINEKQENLLHSCFITEAMGESFSYDELRSIGSFKGRYQYCLRTLGPCQGRGSSRVIFQLSDEKVLKLALNQKGIAQNEAECDWYLQKYDVVPEIFKESDDKNYYFLVSEFVLPAKKNDFDIVFGFDFFTFCRCLVAIWKMYNPRGTSLYPPIDGATLSELLEKSEDLNNFYYYMTDYQPPVGDMLRAENYGLTNRSGTPQIVLLDSGLTNDVYDSYYRRK